MVTLRDTGVFTEADMLARSKGRSPYDVIHTYDESAYREILDVAMLVGMGKAHQDALVAALSHKDSGARYWGATGLAVLGQDAKPIPPQLETRLTDPVPSVRVAAAEALHTMGETSKALPILQAAIKEPNLWVQLEAAATIYQMSDAAKPLIPSLPEGKKTHPYLRSALEHIRKAN